MRRSIRLRAAAATAEPEANGAVSLAWDTSGQPRASIPCNCSPCFRALPKRMPPACWDDATHKIVLASADGAVFVLMGTNDPTKGKIVGPGNDAAAGHRHAGDIPYSDAHANPDGYAHADGDTNADAYRYAGSDCHANHHADADTHGDAIAYTNTDSDSDSHANTDTDTDTYRYAYANA